MAVGDLMVKEEKPAFVRFETRSVEDPIQTREQGKIIYKNVIFALVTPPYSNAKSCHEEIAAVWLAKKDQDVIAGRVDPRFVASWKATFEAFKKGEEPVLDGTDIRDWPAITKADVKNLRSLNILTIEDLADVNGEGLRHLGMGGLSLKQKAQDWVQANKDHTPLVLEVSELKNENQILKDSIKTLEEQVKFLNSDKSFDATTVSTTIEKVSLSPAERYETKFGKKPHHRMKEESILEALGE